YLVGGLFCFFSPLCQRLGDIAGNTVVVHHVAIREPDLDQVASGKFNSLRQHAHIAARLPQRTTPAEAALALHALLRREELEPAARVILFSRLAVHFREKAEFPPEAIDRIPDEQLLRNMVDILYRVR